MKCILLYSYYDLIRCHFDILMLLIRPCLVAVSLVACHTQACTFPVIYSIAFHSILCVSVEVTRIGQDAGEVNFSTDAPWFQV